MDSLRDKQRDLFEITSYVLQTTGIHLTSPCQQAFEQSPWRFQFFPHDIRTMDVRLKHMSVVDYTRALYLHHLGMYRILLITLYTITNVEP
jgi:hypothetical protein